MAEGGGWVGGWSASLTPLSGGRGKNKKKEKKKRLHQLLKVGKRVRAGATNYGRCGLQSECGQ